MDLRAILTGEKSDHRETVRAAAERYGIPADMAERWIKQESGFNPKAVSKKGAQGLSQLMPATAKELGVKDAFDPEENIDAGARYLKAQYDRFGTWPLALAAYNAGPGAVEKAGGIPNYEETKAYVAAISPDGSDQANLGSILGVQDIIPAEKPAPSPDAPLSSSLQAKFDELAGRGAVFEDTEQPLNAAQQANLKQMMAAGYQIDTGAREGSKNRPYGVRNPGEIPTRAGDYYIDLDGGLKTVPQDDPWLRTAANYLLGPTLVPDERAEAIDNRLISGAMLGGKNEAAAAILSIPDFVRGGMPAAKEAFVADLGRMDAADAARHAKFPIVSDAAAVTGAVGGTLLGSEAIGAGLSGLGAGGRFLAGRGGTTLMGKLGSQSVASGSQGALMGGAQGFLGTDGSLEDRQEAAGTGASVGAITGAAAPYVLQGGRQIGEALTTPNRLVLGADEMARLSQGQNLPVPVSQTAGELSLIPSDQMAETLLSKTGSPRAQAVMQDFDAGRREALAANVPAIEARIAGQARQPGQGASMAQERLVEMKGAAKKDVDAAYNAARAVGEDAMLAESASFRDAMLDTVRKDYDLAGVPRVAKEIESFGQNGVPTVRELFDARTRLTNLTNASDQVEAGAARSAKTVLDAQIKNALDNDLFLGNPDAVQAWKTAIGKRADMGKLFEGDDLIERLTETARHGEGSALKVAPEDAANYIMGRSALGVVGKKNLTRDLTRLRDVLGPDSSEWNAIRADVFSQVAKSARGSVDQTGETAFSGQKLANAWRTFKEDAPQVANLMFTAEERSLIDDFAEVAVRTTTKVPGGANYSGSGLVVKELVNKAKQNFWTMLGTGAGAAIGGTQHAGAAAGGAMAGAATGKLFDAFFSDLRAIRAARKATDFRPVAAQTVPTLPNKLIPLPGITGAVVSNKLIAPPAPAQ